jgi:hypothetical protein
MTIRSTRSTRLMPTDTPLPPTNQGAIAAFMVVPCGVHNLAFPLTQVQRIIPLPAIQWSSHSPLGLAQVNLGATRHLSTMRSAARPLMEHPVLVIDLATQLTGDRLINPAYLMLFQASGGLYGVPIMALPQTISVPTTALVPPQSLHLALMVIASHCISRDVRPDTTVVIDLERLCQTVSSRLVNDTSQSS